MSTKEEYFEYLLEVSKRHGSALLECLSFIRDKGLEVEFYEHRSLQRRKQMTKPEEELGY